MKRIYLAALVATAALAALAFTGCNDSMNPIFYTISQEVPVADSSLPNEINVGDMTETADRYFVAAGKVYYRPIAGGDWVAVAPPARGAMSTKIEFFGGNLYAAFFANGELGLYRLEDETATPPVWDLTRAGIDAVFQNVEITLLEVENNELFVGVQEPDGEYALYNFASPGSPLLSDQEEIITDVTFAGTRYLAIGAHNVYAGADATSAWADFTNLTREAGEVFGGIFSTGGKTYLSTSRGRLFVSTNAGADWGAPQTVDEDNVAFTRFIELEAENRILVGTRAHGYFQFNDDGSFGSLERRPDFNIELFNTQIVDFFVNNADDGLFACTTGAGLWRSDDGGDTWSRE